MRLHRWGLAASLVIAVGLTLACNKREGADEGNGKTAGDTTRMEVRVTEVQLGRGVDTAHQITEVIDTFAPGDTIWAAVRTENTPAGTSIVARWVYTEGGDDQIVGEETHTTAQSGTGWTSFFAANPNPWPAGSYELRIVTDGQVRETKGFSVKEGG
jgi:hypothetical protein